MADNTEKINEHQILKIKRFLSSLLARGADAKYIADELCRKLNAWKGVELNIGVIGASGVGKSTFINTMRGVKPTDSGAAAVGVTDCTQEPTPYLHPENPNVKLWDLPGVGTPDFPKDEYLSKVSFDKYDFFIIICCQRFTENDMWFALEVRKRKKLFYFARSKIDIDVMNDRKNYPNVHKEEELLTKIRSNCTQRLIQGGVKDAPVYLICDEFTKYDFPSLETKLISELPKLKREAALLTLRNTSEPFMKAVTKQLQQRVWKVSLGAAAAGILPVPGVSFAVDVAIISRELGLYKNRYSLDDESLRKLSSSSNLVTLVDAIKQKVWFNCTAVELLKHREQLGKVAFKEVSKFVPIFGSIAGSITSYNITSETLHWCIISMEDAAMSLIDAAFNETCPEKQNKL